MTFAIFLDFIVVALLLAAIGIALVLNRRLAAFRAARGEFEQIIERFNTAAARAEAGINSLKMSGAEAGNTLQQNIAKARALRDELTFLVERAEPIVDRLGALPAGAPRPVAAPAKPQVAAAPATKQVAPAAAPAAKPAVIPADAAELFKLLSSLR